MTDREKLIELIGNVQLHGYMERRDANSVGVWSPPNERLADHLIAHGVRLETKQATSDKTSDSKWISVDDEKPKRNGWYLCYYLASLINGNERWETQVLYWEDLLWLYKPRAFTVARKVTHWMPLPQPPREE